MVNVENIGKVIRLLEEVPEDDFYMGDWGSDNFLDPVEVEHMADNSCLLDDCGTPMCIAGWTGVAMARDGFDIIRVIDGKALNLLEVTAVWLGLQKLQKEELFLMMGSTTMPVYVSPATAIACLKHLQETGEVDWDRARTETRT